MAGFKSIGLQLDGTLQTVLTYGGATSATILGLTVSNKDGSSDASVDVFYNDGTTDFYVIGKDTSVPVGQALEALGSSKLVLEPTHSIKAQSSADLDLDIVLSYMDYDA